MSILSRLFQRKPRSPLGGSFAGMDETPPALNTKTKGSKRARSHKGSKPSAMDASEVELYANEDGSAFIGFGLRWRTQVTSFGRDAAQKMAKAANATHFIFRVQQVGYGLLPKQFDGKVYPAALLAAKSHLGCAIFAMSLGDGQYWFAVVRNGQPTNTDEVVSELHDEQAVARIRSLEQQFEGESIAIFSDIRNSGIAAQRVFTLHDLFDVVRVEDDQLQKLKNKQGNIPKPLMYAAFVAVGIMSVHRGYVEWKEYKLRKDREANKVVEEQPELAWEPVVATFLNSTPKPNAKAIVEMRRVLAGLPVLWSGWVLAGARCQAPGDLGPKKSRLWSCQGSYERGRVADTSEQILKKVKARVPQWGVAFPTINTMVVSWTVSQQEQSIQLTDLGDPNNITIQVASQLQGYFPALSTRPEFKMMPYELPPPKRQDGTPHPKPASVPVLFKGDLTLKGPLRSIDAMTQQLTGIEWLSLGLVLNDKSPAGQKGLTISSLNVELTGKVFGKATPKLP